MIGTNDHKEVKICMWGCLRFGHPDQEGAQLLGEHCCGLGENRVRHASKHSGNHSAEKVF